MSDTIIKWYGILLSIGINPISIILMVSTIHFLKTYVLADFEFYSQKNKKWINLLLALIIGFVGQLLFFNLSQWRDIIKCGLISFSAGIASQQLVDGIWLIVKDRFIKKDV